MALGKALTIYLLGTSTELTTAVPCVVCRWFGCDELLIVKGEGGVRSLAVYTRVTRRPRFQGQSPFSVSCPRLLLSPEMSPVFTVTERSEIGIRARVLLTIISGNRHNGAPAAEKVPCTEAV